QSVQTTLSVTVNKQSMDVSPTTLDFGSLNVGTASSSQQLTVTNASGGAMKILSVAAAGDFSETDNCGSSSPLQPGGTCEINVTFTPGGAGARVGKVTIANSFNVIPSSIGLSGTGIGQPTTTTAVSSSANPSVFGQSLTLTATVSSSGGTPTGSVTFNDGSTVLGSEPLTNGQATFSSSSLSVGSHSITAVYGGDGTYQGSTGSLTQSVNPASTTTVVTPSANPSILNGSVTFTATVSVVAPGAGTPTGSITFKNGSTALATVPPNSSGQATFSTNSLAIGQQPITATYSGDSNFAGSTSATLNQAVQYEPVGTSCDGDAGHQILQPIYANGTSVYNQGRTVPAKFRVCDANGVPISAAGTVTSFLLTQIVSGTVTTNVEDIVDTNNPDTAFRWDSTDQQWIFNISTQSLSANQTYVYTITLNDGTTITFQFGLM
ncbi:MAG TPA: Ig-like domain repeat protein, partial [Terriglobia bacterium]|nr:Ig-like domain repeat protein [Terriglobia bacterium]